MKTARLATHRRIPVIVALVWLAVLAAPVYADKSSYLQPGQVDSVAILPSPPAPGSAEQAADLATVESVHKAATPEDMAAAKSEDWFDVFGFAPAIGTFFQARALPKTEAFFRNVERTSDPIQEAAKKFFKRERPYEVDPSLVVARPENSYSYPSAHSTYGTVCALVLADLFPEKRAEILAAGHAIGWHRVQLAKHYPTDIYAGRVLAQAIVRELKSSPAFQQDFAAVKAELTAAAQPAHATP